MLEILEHLPNAFQLYEYMLETVGNLTDYRKVREPTTGKTMQNFILDSLETKYKKQGTNGSVFKKEQGFFKELMERTFYNLMVCKPCQSQHKKTRERSGSVVEGLTRGRGVTCLSLTSVTALWSLSKTHLS